MNIIKKLLLTIFISTGLIGSISAQIEEQLDQLVTHYKSQSIDQFNFKSIDLDNDNDFDYVFSFLCGESFCLRIYINKKGKLVELLQEYGRIEFDFENSNNFEPSHVIIISYFNHCCGESLFDSFRSFKFSNDSLIVLDNYVKFDYENYYPDKDRRIKIEPLKFLIDPYFVKINNNEYNIRFSADAESHNIEFALNENTNIIGKLKKDSYVKVIGEYNGKDRNERTWLYVEVSDSDLITEKNNSPISYGFKEQKLRGWISNKYTTKK